MAGVEKYYLLLFLRPARVELLIDLEVVESDWVDLKIVFLRLWTADIKKGVT